MVGLVAVVPVRLEVILETMVPLVVLVEHVPIFLHQLLLLNFCSPIRSAWTSAVGPTGLFGGGGGGSGYGGGGGAGGPGGGGCRF